MGKQTAIQWQFEQLFDSFEKFNNGEYTFDEFLSRNLKIREQALVMEMGQIIDSWMDGLSKNELQKMAAEKYYNQTYKTETP